MMSDEKRIERLEAVKNRIMNAIQDELKDGEISTEELLSLMAFCTGSCIALQDMATMTPARAMDIVNKNLTAGNLSILKNFPRPQG